MTGIVNWLRESNQPQKGVFIRVKKFDTPGKIIAEVLEKQLGVSIIADAGDFANINAKSIIEITRFGPTEIADLKNFNDEYFKRGGNNGDSWILESYDQQTFLDKVVFEIDYGANYLPIWIAQWTNTNGDIYNWVLDNELDCRFAWIIVGDGMENFTQLDFLINKYGD